MGKSPTSCERWIQLKCYGIGNLGAIAIGGSPTLRPVPLVVAQPNGPMLYFQPIIRARKEGESLLSSSLSMKTLLEAGVHFGHQTRRWNPKMKRFIFAERNGIHIIDLQQTVQLLDDACDFVRDLVSQSDTVLFVGTKKQAQEAIETEAKRCFMPFVGNRWLGGTPPNFGTIQARIDHLVRLEDQRERGEFARLPKKETLKIQEEISRLNLYLGGIK